MRTILLRFLFCVSAVLLFGCKREGKIHANPSQVPNSIRHAENLSLFRYPDFTLVRVRNPWPGAKKDYTYILKRERGRLPDSLQQLPVIQVPVKSLIATSTTHIPSLEMLGVENSLVGFPNCDYISSKAVRSRIAQGKVRELGSNHSLNTEVVLDLDPDVIIGYGIDNNNAQLDKLEKSGLKILLDGDWNETSALGKAEWIKLFGALYGLEDKAERIFSGIEHDYLATIELAKQANSRPTVLAGALYENNWYLPEGNSWGAELIAQAGGNYLWRESKGTGSLSLPFETVLGKAVHADYWIGPGQFTSLAEMTSANDHYAQFDAFGKRRVYSFSSKKGPTGGIIYFELAPNRPDLVLKDMVKILHPELLPDHELYFFERLE